MTSTISGDLTKARIHSLDYLRGLCALGIMVYHYSSWTFGEQPAGSFLGRIGIYGVATFYILSGQALSYNYSFRLQFKKSDLYDFYKKRIFRIFPLLWLATIISIIFSKHIPDFTDVLLNITGLFGIIKWDTYFATGAWSLGNELAFYISFPILILSLNRSSVTFLLILLISLAFHVYFAFYVIHPSIPLVSQWHDYTNPLNQIFLFIGGVALGGFISHEPIKLWYSILSGTLGFILFLSIPIHANAIELVTSWNRLFFSASCFLLCYSFFRKAPAQVLFDRPLTLLGKISYSLYLLHPIVYNFVKVLASIASKKGIHYPTAVIMYLSIPISLIISYLSYNYFEKFFIRISHAFPKHG